LRSTDDVSDANQDRLPSRARWVALGFVLLLILSILWPAPAIFLNEAVDGPALSVDEDSFLGREAPSWDVVFWGIAGLLGLAMIHTADDGIRIPLRRYGRDFAASWRSIAPEFRSIGGGRVFFLLMTASLLVASLWMFADAAILGFAELLEWKHARTAIRLSNRFGGGMNPVLIILWFFLGGLLYRRLRWTHISIAMALAGASAGTAVQLLKYMIGRTRPELWLGPFHHAGPPSTSFPSGHTVGAFAIASVIAICAESRVLRVAAALIAIAIGVSRVLAYRHWPSDVVASALLGSFFGWFFTRCVLRAAGTTADSS